MPPTDDQRASEGVRPGALTALIAQIVEAPEERCGSAWYAALHPGATVGGRFELVRELGRGGFGIVWEARDRELGRSVALKAVRAVADGGLREERLLREAEAAARLSHPNIVTLHDLGRSEHGPYLVLELLRGSTLAERLHDGPVPLDEALRIAGEVAKGLAHAHAQGVVHRDLKPANVFLCEDGQVKVLDLGLAHAFGHRRTEGGTSGYMAPEQVARAPEDERTDVFALGVVLYEMLVGSRPFADERALSSSRPAPVLEVPGEPGVGELVARMLSKTPVARPRDAMEVLCALSAPRRGQDQPRSSSPVRRRRRWRLGALVAVGALLALGAAGLVLARKRSLEQAPAVTVPSVAVLPFADMSPQRDQEYLADGVAEEILSALSRIDGLRVAGRTSSFYFKGRGEDLRVIGARLNVGNVLEGSLRRSGGRLRVTAQLVNVSDGYRVWSETFERDVKDVFAVQDEIARAVASGLRVTLLGDARGAAVARPVSPEAYAEFLRGRLFYRRATALDLQLAIQALDRSIALDPAYAPAHAALAWAHFLYPTFAQGSDVSAHMALATASAGRAVALGAGLADGYIARGWFRFAIDHDLAGARADLEKALSIDPHGVARRTHANLLMAYGRGEEAIATLEAVLRDDPLDVAAARTLGMIYGATGRIARAREVLRQALEVEPQEARVIRELCVTEILDGRLDTALALAERNPVPWMRTYIQAFAYHDLGRVGEARDALGRLERLGDNVAYQIAEVRAWWGDRDGALASLERARVTRDIGLVYVKYDALLRNLRSDSRYAEFLRRMNLPVD